MSSQILSDKDLQPKKPYGLIFNRWPHGYKYTFYKYRPKYNLRKFIGIEYFAWSTDLYWSYHIGFMLHKWHIEFGLRITGNAPDYTKGNINNEKPI